MRPIWLASAALLISTGAACAQPAAPVPPTGPASMPATPPGAMAPGAGNAPTPPPGMMAPPPGMKHWMNGPLPEDAPPPVYLHIAKAALRHHDYAKADDALGHAETRLLTRSVVQGPSIPVDQSPAVSAIEQARQALQAHDPATALQATDAALQALPPPSPAQ